MTEQEMLKEALEWQEHIRKLITATDDELYHKRSKVFDWLIEQAERVQELEEENERLCALNIATTHELNHVDKINKRYRSILENVELTAQYKGYDDIYNFLVEELEGEK